MPLIGTDVYVRSGGSFNPDLGLIPLVSKLAADDAVWLVDGGPFRGRIEPKALVLASSVKRCMQAYGAARKLAHGGLTDE